MKTKKNFPLPSLTNFVSLSLAFLLCLLAINPAQADGVIVNGDSPTDTIAFDGDIDTWTFSASSGDAIRVQIGVSSSTDFSPLIRLYEPGNSIPVATGSGNLSASINHQASLSGTYTVEVLDSSAGTPPVGTGTYTLYLANIPGGFIVPAGDQGGALTNGGVHTGSIDLGDMDLWTFKAQMQDTLRVQIGEVSGTGFSPAIVLYDPDGNQVAAGTGADSASLVHQATLGGTYTVVVRDNNTDVTGSGDYRLYFANIPGDYSVQTGDQGGALTNGGVHTGSIDLGDMDLWTFNADALDGYSLTLTNTSGSGFTPNVRVYGPDGNQLNTVSDTTSIFISGQAGIKGTYTVLVRDNNVDVTGTGAYQISYALTPDATTVPAGPYLATLQNGGVFTGIFDSGADLDKFHLTVDAGDRVLLRLGDLQDTGNVDPVLQVYAANGSLIAAHLDPTVAQVEFMAEASETLTVVAFNNDNPSGTYDLFTAIAPQGYIIPAGDEGGTLTNGMVVNGSWTIGDIDMFSLAVNAGDTVRLMLGDLTGSGLVEPALEIFDSTGKLLASDLASVIARTVFTAETSETLTVVVYNKDASGSAGTYDLHVAVASQIFSTPDGDEGGTLDNGMVASGYWSLGDIDMYSLAVNAGDTVRLRLGKSAGAGQVDPGLQVFAADGTLIATHTAAEVARTVFTVEASQTLTVVVFNNDIGSGGAYDLHAAIAPQTYSIPTGDEGGILANGMFASGSWTVADIDMYSLAVNAGETVRLRLGKTAGAGQVDPGLQVFAADGTLIATHTAAEVARTVFTAEASQTLTVVVFNNDVGTGGAYDLHAAVAPQAFVIPPGDEGGVLSDSVTVNGNLATADMDLFTFSVLAGASVNITLEDLSGSGLVDPAVYVFASDGLLITLDSAATLAQVTFTAPATDTLMAVIVNIDTGTGAYYLLANGITTLDSDTDNLSDALELMIGTSRVEDDTDGDGVSDYDEVNYDSDATGYNPATDLNPLLVDTDGDGVDDATELLNGTDPLDPNDYFILGDLDFNTSVDIADYLKLLRFVLGTSAETPLPEEIEAGDMNLNGDLDTGDLVIHLRTVLGIN
jgi:hypothetical protein